MPKKTKTEKPTTGVAVKEETLPDMTTAEQSILVECEQTIAKGMESFLDTGIALARIQNGKLYRATHKTFEAYCQEKWDMNRLYAYRLIQGSTLAKQLNPPPVNERQVRPLLSLDNEADAREAWRKANAIAEKEGRAVTGADVANVVGKPEAGKTVTKSIPKSDLQAFLKKLAEDKNHQSAEAKAVITKLNAFVKRYGVEKKD